MRGVRSPGKLVLLAGFKKCWHGWGILKDPDKHRADPCYVHPSKYYTRAEVAGMIGSDTIDLGHDANAKLVLY
jgi:hypothetical protein